MFRENVPSVGRVRVDREKLLTVLKANRAAHRDLFEEAMEGYRTQSIKILEEHIQRIKDNKPERVQVSLPLPEDHTSDYDRVIQMVEWSLDEEVWLEDTEFDQFVSDNWNWKPQFLATATSYVG